MSVSRSIDLTSGEAARLVERELQAARDSLHSSQMDVAQDRFVGALGVALQLGPGAVVRVLLELMRALRELTPSADTETLSTLGPALVLVVSQVQENGALPPSKVMEAWATVASDVGALIGQVGLALSIESDRRRGMMANARNRAATLDEATGSRFAVTAWIDQTLGGFGPDLSPYAEHTE
jgi:hypothetical protein